MRAREQQQQGRGRQHSMAALCCGLFLVCLVGCKPQAEPPVPGETQAVAPATALVTLAPVGAASPEVAQRPEVFLESPGGMAFAHGAYDIAYRALSTEAPQDPKAAYLLGQLFEQGLGIVRNTRRAMYWYVRAAEADVAEAHYALGMMMAYSQELPNNYNEAFRWFQQAAERGHREAKLQLGLMYANGMGIAKDPDQGLMWLAAAVADDVPGAVEAQQAVAQRLGRQAKPDRPEP